MTDCHPERRRGQTQAPAPQPQGAPADPALRVPLPGAHRRRAGGAGGRLGGDAGRPRGGPAHRRLRLRAEQGRADQQLLRRHAGRRGGAGGGVGRPLLLRDDAGRAGRLGPAARRVRPPDAAGRHLLRHRAHRRAGVAAHRRHHAAEVLVRLVRFRAAAQPVPVRGRARPDGRDEREAFRLRVRGAAGGRAAAGRLGPHGAPALAGGAGHAGRRHRLRHREPGRGARDAGLQRARADGRPLRRRGGGRLRGVAPRGGGAGDPHRRGHHAGVRQRRLRAVVRRARRADRPDDRRPALAVRALRRARRQRARPAQRGGERDRRRRRRRRAHRRAAGGAPGDRRPRRPRAAAGGAAGRRDLRGRLVRLSLARRRAGAARPQLHRPAGGDGRHRGAVGRRQDDPVPAPPALLRPRRRPHPLRRGSTSAPSTLRSCARTSAPCRRSR